MNKAQNALMASISLALLTLGACKKEEAPAAPAVAAPAPAAAPAAPPPPPSAEQMAQAAQERSSTLEADSTTWTPEAMEELLAPIALYPDTVLEQVLVASTNPQEVLDAGNWLFDNPNLKGKALDEAAESKGFTPPVLALVQFPETVDMLCQEMAWTTELGQAYVNDQAGVMEAVQRLRRQASDVGTLKSSPKMTVSTQTVDKVQYVTVSPPSPEVIYVPQYDPVAAYAPPPAPAAAPAAAPATTTVVQEGHSDGAMVTTAIFAFGAGMLVNEIFDDDDDYCDRYSYSYNCHGGSYWGRPPVYYPPYPYRPNYGNGFYPSYGYNRPGYNNDSFNNNNVNININGNNNDYWNRYDNNNGYNGNRNAQARSPITQANPKRNDLNDLNRQAAKGPKRPAPTQGPQFNDKEAYKAARPADRTASTRNSITGKPGASASGKVQGTYKGAKPNNDKMAAGKAAGAAASRDLPKVQGSYAGSKDKSGAQNRDVAANKSARPTPDKGTAPRPQPANKGGADRGHADANRDRAQAQNRPQSDKSMPNKSAQDRQQQDRQQQDRMQQERQAQSRQQQDRQQQNRQQNQQRSSAVSGSSRGGNDARAASQRGKQSMPEGARSKQPANRKQR